MLRLKKKKSVFHMEKKQFSFTEKEKRQAENILFLERALRIKGYKREVNTY